MNKFISGRFVLFVVCLLVGSVSVAGAAELKVACANNSFTSFAVGVESITYQEKTQLRDGNTVKTKTTLTNVVQRSAGYTSVSPNTGFFLETASALDTGVDREEWDHAVAGVIQNNEMKVSVSELNLLGAYHVHPGHMFTAGIDVFSLNFSRSDVYTSNKVQNAALGAVSEDSFSFTGVLGYRYDSAFVRPEDQLRLRFGVKASVPVYYKVYNSGSAELERQLDATDNYVFQTGHSADDGHVDADGYLISGVAEAEHYQTKIVQSDPITLEKVFGGGYGVGADVAVGWRLNTNFTIQLALEALYRAHDEIKESGFTLPEVKVTVIRGLAGIVWNF